MTATDRSGGHYVAAIDGLRALAILAVMLFHLRPYYLPGGFVGVDIFFVISGFVVTAALARRRGRPLGAFLASFYTARIVRIMPPLLVMLVVVAGFTALFVRAEGMMAARELALPAFLGIANLALIRAGDDYFSPDADYHPLLHSWTLGVEEQFYLILPLLLFWAWRAGGHRGDRRSFGIVFGTSLASFALCALVSRFDPRAAFYLMPTRFWELGAGALLYLTASRWSPALERAPRTGAWLAAGSCAALAAAFLLQGKAAFPFPGALLPVAASLPLLALAYARPADLLPRLLATPPARAIGLLSYSLYLWHWPVFVLMRWTIGTDGIPKALAALAVTLLLATASYLSIERPAREARLLRRLHFGALAAIAAGLTLVSAAAATALLLGQQAFASRTAGDAYWHGRAPAGCTFQETRQGFAGGELRIWTPECPPRTSVGRLVVVGDSHLIGYTKMLMRLVAETGTPVVLYAKNGCGFLRFGNPFSPIYDCDRFHLALRAELPRILRPGDVLFLPGMRVPHLIDRRTGLPSGTRHATEAERTRGRREALDALRRISATGATTVLEAPKPVFRFAAMRCSDWFNARNMACRAGPEIARSELLRHRAHVVEDMAAVTRSVPGVRIWDPFPILCPGETCSPYRDGHPLFIDADHLSGRGSDVLYEEFAAELLQAVAAAPRRTGQR